MFSIITIAYNCEACIGKTIESVLNQTYFEKAGGDTAVEYLIIDGASKDGTVKVAESYRQALEEKSITYRIISEKDQGIYDAMNKGILLASEKIIGILNSGDWYEENALEVAAQTFQTTNCDLMYGEIRMHRQNGSTFLKTSRDRTYQTSRDWNHPTTFVKAHLYKENLFPKLGIHDDYGFFLKMKKAGKKIEIVHTTMANFQMGGASNHKNIKAAVSRIKDRYLYCYRNNGYSRAYIIECVAIEAVKMIWG